MGHAGLYKKRKETIERVFADAKEKQEMCYTFCGGLAQVTNGVRLKFTARNQRSLHNESGREGILLSFGFCLSFFTCFLTLFLITQKQAHQV